MRRPEKEKEVATFEDDGDLPGPSFFFSPKKKTSVQTQTTESSFSTVTDSTFVEYVGKVEEKQKQCGWGAHMSVILEE